MYVFGLFTETTAKAAAAGTEAISYNYSETSAAQMVGCTVQILHFLLVTTAQEKWQKFLKQES